MSPVRVVPALDEAKDGQTGLGLRREAAAGQQLTLQSRAETLGHRVLVTIADPPVSAPDPEFSAALPEGQRGILGGFNRSSQRRTGAVSDDDDTTAAFRSSWARSVTITRSASRRPARGAATVLGGRGRGAFERRCGDCR